MPQGVPTSERLWPFQQATRSKQPTAKRARTVSLLQLAGRWGCASD
jgi:hypothetical protein